MAKSENAMINDERKRLLEVLKEVPADKLAVVSGLVDQAAFMRVTLNRLQATIKESDLVETYQHGEGQSGVKQSAELQAYNALVKNYSTVIRQLVQHIPKPVQEKQPRNALIQLLEESRKTKSQ